MALGRPPGRALADAQTNAPVVADFVGRVREFRERVAVLPGERRSTRWPVRRGLSVPVATISPRGCLAGKWPGRPSRLTPPTCPGRSGRRDLGAPPGP
eukprot:5279277-Pyramimonas_sp.AAC.1